METTTMKSAAEITKKAERVIRSATDTLDSFKNNLAADAFQAFNMCEDAFEASARIRVWGVVKANAYRVSLEATQREVMRMSRSPEHSTSPSSNLVKQFELAAWCEVAEFLGEE